MGEKADAKPATDLTVVESVGDLSVEHAADAADTRSTPTTPAPATDASVYPSGPQPTDGGDVAPSRDPDAIAREIEATRAELAEAIDAIAERMSPKRAASRGAQAVKAQVASAREKVTGESPSRPTGSGSDSAMPELPAPASRQLSLVGPIAAAVAALAVVALIVKRRRG